MIGGTRVRQLRRLLAVVLAWPQRLLLSLVAAGVIGGLALGAARVWFSANYGAGRRRD